MSAALLAAGICHLLGDFYLQTQKGAREKQASGRGLCIHALLYGLACLPLIALSPGWQALLLAICMAGAHFFIDTIKFFIKTEREAAVFVSDQALHAASLYALTLLFPLSPAPWLPVAFLRWALLLLLIGKTANVSFQRLFARYRTVEQEAAPRAGALIGGLERLLAVILLHLGQYAALGLVLTAKSIARYDGITKNPAFAEYFLIGTLYSLLFALLGHQLAFWQG